MHAGDDSLPERGAILEAITRLQTAVIAGETGMRAAFEHALGVLLEVTGSQYGFIGEVRADPGGARYLRTLAITDIGWDEASRALAALARSQGLEFRNLDTLFGAPMKDEQPLIANDAPRDPRAGGLPPGHPPLDAFLALPLSYGGRMVGLAGLANRPNGYGEALLEALAPLASALAAMITAETAKAERDRNAERAQLAVAGSDAAIWDWEIASGAVWWSDQLKAMLGVPREATPSFERFIDHVHPEDRAALTAAVDATLERDAPYNTTCRLRRADGGYATIRTTGHLVRDADGAPERLVGVQIDITREMELQRRAGEAGALLEIATASGLASWRWDVEADLYYLDDRLCALLDRPDFAGRAIESDTLAETIHPEDRAMIADELHKVLRCDRHVFRKEHRILTPGGDVRWLRAYAGRTPDGAVVGMTEDRTAAKHAELALATANDRYDLAVNGSLIAVWDWDVTSGDLYWSDRFLEILGLSREDFTGRHSDFADRVHPEDMAQVDAALDAHLERGEPYDIEFRMRHADGRWVTVRGRGARAAASDGQTVRMAGSIQDVTAERDALEAAKDAALKIGIAARHAGISAVEIDLEAGVMRGDEGLSRILGSPDRTTIGLEEVAAIVHPDDRAAFAARRAALDEPGAEAFELENRIVRPDGAVAYLETVAIATRRDAKGRPLRLSGVVIDQTERRETERELAAAKERYDLAVTGSHMAIWDQDLATREVYWSPRFGEMLGYGPIERREPADRFAARIHPADLDRARRDFNAMVEHGAPYDITVRLRRVDGGFIHVRSRAGVLHDDTGAPVRVCGSMVDVTDEIQARARADLALKAANMGIWEWSLPSGVVTADARFAEMFGRPDLSERPGPIEAPLQHVHEEDRPRVRGWLADLKAGRTDRMEVEHRVVRPDGSQIWLGGSASVVDRGGDGRPRRVLGVFEDRTARKTAELELAEAKRRYDVAVTGSHAAIWDQDLRTNMIYWSARMGEILGLGAEERTEPLEAFLERTHPDDVEMARRNARHAIDTGGVLDNTMRIRRADGVYRHLRSRAGILHDGDGKPVRICGSIVDVTDELEAQAEARVSGRRAELALEAAHLGVWDYVAETGLSSCDATLAALLGDPGLAERALTVDELMGFTHPDHLKRVRADIDLLHSGRRSSVSSEHRIVRGDGETVWIRADVGVAERNPDGSVARLLGVVQDLSGVKLTEELLRKSAEAARQASAAKSQFLATMSHEIRTPLNGVLGVVQLLERTELNPRQRRYVDTIKASGRSLANVIEDVLDISRIEAGRLQLRPEPAVVVDILEQACAPSRALAAKKGVALNLTVAGDLIEPVLVDPRRVTQMIGNLVGNAVKFTDKGGVRVRAHRPDKALLRIEVDDDGPGVPEDMHEAVFERFTQTDMSHSRPHEGAGLGLAIVRELAQLAGGVAGVRSRPGEGACFWIEIPAPAAASRSTGPQEPEQAVKAGCVAATPLRVLVVEDQPVNRAVIAELVSEAGHTCETADSGGEALRSLASRPVDLVLLDLHMPGMDGAEVLARIRRGEAGRADLPVYIVTADATPEARAKTLALGADGFIVKPLDADRLCQAINAVAERTRGAG